MNIHIFSIKKKSAVILVLLLANSLLYSLAAQAQKSQNQPTLVEKIKRFFFGTRPGGVATNRNKGGSVRGRCPNLTQNLNQTIFALVPTDQGTPFVEQTITDHPTFWFYVSSLPVSQLNAEFVLIDNKGNDIYSTIFPLRQQPGIIGLQLPKTVPPLKQGNKYRWVFSAICNPQNRAADALVNGWLERIPLSSTLSNQLKSASTRERVSVYTDAKLWYETLTNLAELQRSYPKDVEIQSDWVNVLQLVGLPANTPQNWTIYPLPSQAENRKVN